MNDFVASFAYGAMRALLESGGDKNAKRPRKARVRITRPKTPQMSIPFPDLGVDGPNPFNIGGMSREQPLQENTKLKDIPVSLRDTVNPEMYHPSRETDTEGVQDSIPWMSR